MPIQNIGLAGRAGSGKGVLAAELVKRGYAVVSFAAPVKIAVGRMVLSPFFRDVTDEQALAYVARHKDVLRPMLQAYGVAMRTLVDEGYWIRLALADAGGKQPVVIDDVRFPNEVAALKAAGFVTVRIERPHLHRTLYGGNTLTGEQATHSSEAQIEGLAVDAVIHNTGDSARLLQCCLNVFPVLAGIRG